MSTICLPALLGVKLGVMSKRLQSQQISQLRLNLTSPKSLAVLEEIDDSDNAHNNFGEDESDDQLFHTICNGTSANAFAFPEGKHNVLWFLLEESIIDLCDNLMSTSPTLKEGIVREAHSTIETLTRTEDAERLLFLRFKTNLLPKVMCKLRSSLDEPDYRTSLPLIWDRFWFHILPAIECLLYEIQCLSNESIRNAAISSFRDHFLLTGKFEESLRTSEEFRQSKSIRHMILVIQNLRERSPPTRKHLEMERLTSLIIPEYLGYAGLYTDGKLSFKARQDRVQERAQPFQPPTSPLGFKITSKYRAKTKLQRKISLQPQAGSSHFNNAKYLKFMSKLYK